MIKRVFLSLFIILSFYTLKANVDGWSLHLSYHNASKCEIMDNRVFVLASGSLYSYSEEDEEIRTYDKISHLNDFKISDILYSEYIDALIIIYDNANIDIMYSDESVYNISDFKNKNISNKNINSISIKDNKALLSTSFGVVELDLENKEFINTYTLEKNVNSAIYHNNGIYVATDNGILYGNLNDNLLDKSKWKFINNNRVKSFALLDNSIYCINETNTICRIDNTNSIDNILSETDNFLYLYADDNSIISATEKKLYIIESDNTINKYNLGNEKSNFIRIDGERIWNCKGYAGLIKCKINNNNISDESESIIPNSPIRNYCNNILISDDKLLVAGGNINYLGTVFYDATLMEMNTTDYTWFNYPEDVVKNSKKTSYNNVCTVDEDPLRKGHIFAGTFGTGIYEFEDGEFIKNYSMTNSPLESVLQSASAPEYVRISKVKFDKEGNLWILNTGTESPIKKLMNDGSWENVYYNELDKLPTLTDIHFDSRGWMWIVSLRKESGLFCAKTKNTDTTSDDETGWYSQFINQDGLSYSVYEIYGFAEDKNGKIWLGTDAGLFVIDNANKFFKDGIFTQIKIPRNDGTGLADYLMNGVNIQCIHVDGANRKWIGTKHNGVYLISEDGLETIKHFTTENSPLPSNNIVSVAVNGKNGEVFIGTDNGIASFNGDATEASPELDENNIYAYPNPVRADYRGDINIIGLTFDCNVKIVDTAGKLVCEGISKGGTFTWDGRDKKGDRVASGVYYVLTYDNKGNEGAATKILFIR